MIIGTVACNTKICMSQRHPAQFIFERRKLEDIEQSPVVTFLLDGHSCPQHQATHNALSLFFGGNSRYPGRIHNSNSLVSYGSAQANVLPHDILLAATKPGSSKRLHHPNTLRQFIWGIHLCYNKGSRCICLLPVMCSRRTCSTFPMR